MATESSPSTVTARDLNPEAWDAFWDTDPIPERDYLARRDPREAQVFYTVPGSNSLGTVALQSF